MASGQSVPEVATEHYEQQRAVARRAAQQARKAWDDVDPAAITGSWRMRKPAATAATTSGQRRAAGQADGYVDRVVAGRDRAGSVRPESFAGVASDGRELETLLDTPVARAKTVIARGGSVQRALTAGGQALDRIVLTQVLDAGREATQTAIAVSPKVEGWIRVLSVPSCGRCAILAGKWYGWNAGFRRHPRCDCVHMPCSRVDSTDLTVRPRDYFEVLTPAEQSRYFGKAGAQAIRDGADMASVVNARSKGSVYTTANGKELTRDGQGRAVKGRRRAARPTPTQIYLDADGDRDEAVRLLKLLRYIT